AEHSMRLAQLCLALARYGDAFGQLEQAAAIYRARDDGAGLEWAAAQSALIQALGDTAEHATEHVQRIVESLEAQHAPQHVAEVHSVIYFHYYTAGRYREVVPILARRIVSLSRTAPCDRALAQALTRAVAALLLTGFSADALRSAEEAVPLYEAAGEWTALCQTLHLAAVVHTSAG